MIWTLHNGGKLEPGEIVAPDERLTWGRTIGLGAQHVVAMFGATFVFPILMGLNPQLAVMMSGIATLVFIFVTKHEVPSYLGSSASFPGVAAAIYASGGKPNDVSGALFVVGLTLFLCGIIIHAAGAKVVHRLLPPVVTGAVVMLIGFNLAPVVAKTYWPVDQWTALIVMVLVVALSVAPRGFLSRIAIFVALIIGYVLSWLEDLVLGPMHKTVDGVSTTVNRVDWSGVRAADWVGLPQMTDLDSWTYTVDSNGAGHFGAGNVVGFHLPAFHLSFILLALPVVIALIAENTGHVKADLCREHRRHGGHQGVLHRRVRRRRTRGHPLRVLPEIRRHHLSHPRWRPGWNHRRALRHDWTARCQDLEGEPGRFR